MNKESKRWLRQVEADLKAAKDSANSANYQWAGFQSQLDKSFVDIDEEARILDTYYIPTKFPNRIDEEIAPFEYYHEKDAEKCLKCATLILEKVKKFLKN